MPDADQLLMFATEDASGTCSLVNSIDTAGAARLIGKQGFDCLSSRVTAASLIRLLNPQGLVDDSIIAAFGKLTQARQGAVEQPIIVLDTNVLGLVERYKSNAAKYRINLPQLRNNELILIPANIRKNHWALFVIDLARRQVLLADSLLQESAWPAAELDLVVRFLLANVTRSLDGWTKAVMLDVPQ